MDTPKVVDISPTREGWRAFVGLFARQIIDSTRQRDIAATTKRLESIVETAYYLGATSKIAPKDEKDAIIARFSTYMPRLRHPQR